MDQEQVMNLIQNYAQQNQISFEEIWEEFVSESPENQQKFLQEISQSLQTDYAKTGIKIKPENVGKFTAKAKNAGMSVSAFERKVLANKEHYSPATVKQANFSHNARSWNKQVGGSIPINPNGYWDLDPLEEPEVMIPSGDISMVGIDYEIDAFDARTGKHLKRMQPGQQYKFPTDMVVERPVYAQTGGDRTKEINKLVQQANEKLNKSKSLKFSDKKRKDALDSQNREISIILREIDNLSKMDIIPDNPDAGVLNKFGRWVETTLPTGAYRPSQYQERLNILQQDLSRALKGQEMISDESISLNELYNKYPTGRASQASALQSTVVGLASKIATLPDMLGRTFLGDYDLNYGLYPEVGTTNVPVQEDVVELEDIPTESIPSNVSLPSSTRRRSTTPQSKPITTTETVPTKKTPSFLPSLEDEGDVLGRYEVPNATKPESTLWTGDVGAMSKVADIVDPSTGRYMYSEESPSSEGVEQRETFDPRRLIGTFDTRQPIGAYREMMLQANQPLAEPYRDTPDLRWAEIPLIDLNPLISEIADQEYAALQNVDTSTAAGRAYANQVMQNTQKAVINASNQVTQQNQQIKAQNENSRVNAINQMESNRVNADRQYVDDLQRADATRNMLRLNARSYMDQLEATRRKENNNMTAIMMNLPQISSEEDGDTRKFFLDTSYIPTPTGSSSMFTTPEGKQMVKTRDKDGKIIYQEVVTGNQDKKQTGGKMRKKFKMNVW